MPKLRRLLCACLMLLAAVAAADPIVVHYPQAESIDDERGEYGLALLQLALAKSGGLYRVELSPTRMQQNRALVELQAGSGRIDIVGTMTSAEREQTLLPVRIPMTRGMIGWRLGLLRADRKDLLRDVRAVDDLRQFATAQGHDWPDLRILRHSGLKVYPVAVYSGLFGMLNAGRIDWAPRSANEIWAEAARHPELAVDTHIALHYVTADYFFVNRNNPALAEAVRAGLEAALADGSFAQLFKQHYGPLLRKARFDQRRVIELPNPLLTPQTPLARKELWLTLDDLKRHP
ncbi:transporter substrate-binding domain-containing protein [Rugamonas sp. A1-17]|nr:transporter substrate-binding domain-containing protein [Rugamonas sp. A1-17]